MEKIEVKSVSKVAFDDERIVLVGSGFELMIRLLKQEHHGKIKVGDDFFKQLEDLGANTSMLSDFFGTVDNDSDEKVIQLEQEIISLTDSRNELIDRVGNLNDSESSLRKELESAQKANELLSGHLSARDSAILDVQKENNSLKEKIGELSAAAEKKRTGK